jgi:hypothetical protein
VSIVAQEEKFGEAELVKLFNEWMDRYQRDPAAFEAEFDTVSRFRKEQESVCEPSYGGINVAYLLKLREDLKA